jgi:hypothetical protein
MGMFDFLKKDKGPDYDPTQLKVTDLDKGFVFEYDLRTWVVEEAYEYDWGSNDFTREFKITDGSEIKYLSVDADDHEELSLTEKVKMGAIEEDIIEAVKEKERPPKKIHYKGMTFYRDEESPGYFRNMADKADADDSWDELISWDYYDDDEAHVMTIEQWGDHDFEASFGLVIKTHEISNILPGTQA